MRYATTVFGTLRPLRQQCRSVLYEEDVFNTACTLRAGCVKYAIINSSRAGPDRPGHAGTPAVHAVHAGTPAVHAVQTAPSTVHTAPSTVPHRSQHRYRMHGNGEMCTFRA